MTIEKTVDPRVAVIGSVVTYAIDVSHTSTSTAPAFDVLVTDGIPTGLTLNPSSITIKGSTNLPTPTITSTPTQFAVYWASFPVSETASITVQATFVGPSPVLNSANVEWSSTQIGPNPQLVPLTTCGYSSNADKSEV